MKSRGLWLDDPMIRSEGCNEPAMQITRQSNDTMTLSYLLNKLDTPRRVGPSRAEHVNTGNMAPPGTWGTDVEIYALAAIDGYSNK